MFRDLEPTNSKKRLAMVLVGIVGIAVGGGLFLMNRTPQQPDPATTRTAANLLVLPPADSERLRQSSEGETSIVASPASPGSNEQAQRHQPVFTSKHSVSNNVDARKRAKQIQLSAARNKIASRIPYNASPLEEFEGVSSSSPLPPPPDTVKAPAKPVVGGQVDLWLGNKESILIVPPSREPKD
jgi:hypothetical protein